MAAKYHVAKYLVIRMSRNCIHHSRYTEEDGWQLYDVALSSKGNIALTSLNLSPFRVDEEALVIFMKVAMGRPTFFHKEHQTSLDVYSEVTAFNDSDASHQFQILYSKEFDVYEKEGHIFHYRLVAFASDDVLVTCLGDKLEVIQVNGNGVLRSRRLSGSAMCMSVRGREIFVGFIGPNRVHVYDVMSLKEMKKIILHGICDGEDPFDMTVIAEKILVCVGDGREGSNYRALLFEEKSGKILSELTKPSDTQWYAKGITVNQLLQVVAVAWSPTYLGESQGIDVVAFYSLSDENNSSFLIVEVPYGVCRIRLSDAGDRMIMKFRITWEVHVYDMAEFVTYSDLTDNLRSQLTKEDCVRVAWFFALPKDEIETIENTGTPVEILLFSLEEAGVVQDSNMSRLANAFREFKITSSCLLTEFYQSTRVGEKVPEQKQLKKKRDCEML